MTTKQTTETVEAPFGFPETKREQFEITTREHGEWFLRKIANLRAERERITAQYQTMMRQSETDESNLIERYGSQFENLVRAELDASKSKRKSLTFFNGTAGFRTVPARIVIDSEADALQTARLVAPASITAETVERFDKQGFRAYAASHFEETGELLPGFTRTEERQSFDIKFPAAKEEQPTE
jgi:hypothetical protein